MAAVATIGRPARLAVPTRPRRHVARRPLVRGRGRASAATFRRRRVVALVLAFAGIVGTARAAVALGGPIPLAAPEQPPAVTTYVVQPGDSLWTVAEEVAPDTDPRKVVDALVEVRGDAPLIPGERITWGGST